MIIVYGCWGAGTSMIAKSIIELGFNPGNNLMKETDKRNLEACEDIAFADTLKLCFSQKTLKRLKTKEQTIELLQKWKDKHPEIEVVKHPLTALCTKELEEVFPGHKKVWILRGRDSVLSTMRRREWGFWKDSHYENIYKNVHNPEEAFQEHYQIFQAARERKIDRLTNYLEIKPTQVQRRNAISAIRPYVNTSNEKIFIAVATLEDKRLVETIEDAIAQALAPENLVFGIFDQRDTEDKEITRLINKYPNQIRYIRVPRSEARGVGYARAEAAKLMQDESWYLQIDSHMKFQRHWDAICFDQWYLCNDEKAVISTFLPHYSFDDKKENWDTVDSLKITTYDKWGIPLLGRASNKKIALFPKPFLHHLIVAHFIFCKSEVIKQVPIDPEIYFYGEESGYSIRLFTHGYNTYAPLKLPMLHQYGREETRPKVWQKDDLSKERSAESAKRVKTLFGYSHEPVELGVYGLGQEKSLEEYKDFTNLDFGKVRAKGGIERRRHANDEEMALCEHVEVLESGLATRKTLIVPRSLFLEYTEKYPSLRVLEVIPARVKNGTDIHAQNT